MHYELDQSYDLYLISKDGRREKIIADMTVV